MVLCVGTSDIEEYGIWRDALNRTRQRAQERTARSASGSSDVLAQASADAEAANQAGQAPGAEPQHIAVRRASHPASQLDEAPSTPPGGTAMDGPRSFSAASSGALPLAMHQPSAAVATPSHYPSGRPPFLARRVSVIPPELQELEQLAKMGPVAGLPQRHSAHPPTALSSIRSMSTSTRQRVSTDVGTEAAFSSAEEEELDQDAEADAHEADTRDSDIWRLSELENGLRFEEDCRAAGGRGLLARLARGLGGEPVPCRVRSRVAAPPKLLYHLLSDLGTMRENWDPTFACGCEVEADSEDELGGHSQVIHVMLRPQPVWGRAVPTRVRDLVLLTHWRLEDGAYLMTFTSTPKYDAKVPVAPGVVRLSTGGFLEIRPLGSGDGAARGPEQSLVTMVLEKTEPKGLQAAFTGRPRAFQKALLLGYVAGLRDFVDQLSEAGMQRLWKWVASRTNGDMFDGDEGGGEDGDGYEESRLAEDDEGDVLTTDEAACAAYEPGATASEPAEALSRVASSRASDVDCARKKVGAASSITRMKSRQALSDLDASAEDAAAAELAAAGLPGNAGGTVALGAWPERKGQPSIEIYCQPDDTEFRVRSKSYLTTGIKTLAGQPTMQLVGVDWIYADEPINDVCARPGNGIQQTLLRTHPKAFVLCVNIQVPALKQYSIIFYYAMPSHPAPGSLLRRFVDGDDAFRNARFKLIPSITQGPWVVARSVGTKPLIVGNALKVN